MSKYLPLIIALVYLILIGVWYYTEIKHDYHNCYACWLTPVCVTLFCIALLVYDIYCKELENKKHEFEKTMNHRGYQYSTTAKLSYSDVERIVLELKRHNISSDNLAGYVEVLRKLDVGESKQATETAHNTQTQNHNESQKS